MSKYDQHYFKTIPYKREVKYENPVGDHEGSTVLLVSVIGPKAVPSSADKAVVEAPMFAARKQNHPAALGDLVKDLQQS